MSIKVLGALFIIGACGATGWSIARDYRREENALQQLIHALDYMGNELQMRLTPLPQLCKLAQDRCSGDVQSVFRSLGDHLETQSATSASECMEVAIQKNPKLTRHTKNALKQLGVSLGKFDLMGQLQGMEAVKKYCNTILKTLRHNKDSRLRSYQTLGLCAGIAIAILFI